MNFDERTLNGMGVLAAVVRSGSFAAAGKVLCISQSGVSRAISRLEQRVGVRLLERTSRSVTLTAEGRRLHEQILPLLAGLEEAAASIQSDGTEISGRLRVNADALFTQLLLGSRLREFLEQYPRLTLELDTGARARDLAGEGYDLAIRFGDPPESSMIARRLLEARVLTVAAPAYLKRHGQPKSPEELREGHVLIDYRDPDSGQPFEWIFQRGRRRISIETRGRLMVNDVVTMHAACLSGYGVAQVLELGMEKHLRSGRLVELFPDWPEERFPLFALYPSRKHLPLRTRAFLEFVEQVAGS
ncbi:MAG: LysR family transcriptional regulator [Acidobacteria bacterium]|nr:LysR family transcriptional regulator [Acidobacteriota bacterium]